jgi:hypothetical protein
VSCNNHRSGTIFYQSNRHTSTAETSRDHPNPNKQQESKLTPNIKQLSTLTISIAPRNNNAFGRQKKKFFCRQIESRAHTGKAAWSLAGQYKRKLGWSIETSANAQRNSVEMSGE